MNVLLVFADQMRGQALGCAGNKQVKTPVLDRLAEEGTMFTHAYANSPVCTPSRGTLLTGLYPHKHGAVTNDIPIKTDVAGMGTIFKEAGYATGYIGKWHLDGCPRDKFTPPGPRRLGFDYWAVHNCNHQYWDSFYYTDSEERIPIEGYEPQHQTELACKFMEEHQDERWLLTLSWAPPHDPYDTAPDEFKKMFKPKSIKLRPNVPEEDAEAAREKVAGYYAHIAALDELMGRMIEKLDELGLTDKTLIIFTSDHGDMLHSHGLRNKQLPHEESVSVPLIMRKPNLVPQGERCEELLGLVDLLPTVMGLMRVESEALEGMDGEDMSSVIRGDGRGRYGVLLMDQVSVDQGSRMGHIEWRGIRTCNYTYCRKLDGPWILFDNERDPHQQDNLVEDPDYKSIREELDRRLDKQLAEADDTFQPWQELIRSMRLVEEWNERERHMHGNDARLIE